MADAGNPYFGLINIISEQASKAQGVSFLIGKVTSITPILIDAGIQLSRDDILINDSLLNNYKRSFDTNKIGIETIELTTNDGLKVGDKLFIMVSQDQQTFVVVSKVI